MKEVSTSFLSDNDYKKLIKELNNSDTDYIHFDVMDGKFVNNKNLSISELEKLLKISDKKNDIHLMVEDPSKYIDAISLYNIANITIHKEIKNYEKYLEQIKNYGIKCGISLNPDTNVEDIYNILDKVNLVLIMSVIPGKSGQSFRHDVIPKIEKLKQEINKRGLNITIEIDGGVCDEVLSELKDVDIIVSASYILKDLNNIKKLHEL